MGLIQQQFCMLLLLLLLVYSYAIHALANGTITIRCLPEQSSALLQLKRSFYNPNLSSWQAGADCCQWEGVTCDTASGQVIALNLSDRNLRSRGLDLALFNLTSLQNLSLAGNNFQGARLPTFGFERLTKIVHLDFSYTNFFGQIPVGIAHLKKLVVLNFRGGEVGKELYLQDASLQGLIANLSNLRELYLDGVDLSSSGATWSIALADSVPRLQTLSLSFCCLSGSIHPSFSRLRSLTVIKIRENYEISGKVPEFFANFSFLTTLDLCDNDFEGQFPSKIFQLKNLRVLDVSWNTRLSGRLSCCPVGNNLEKLYVHRTNFSDYIHASFVNLKSLKSLGVNTEGISKELSLIAKLPSLDKLVLSGSGLGKPRLSWVGKHKHLSSLMLVGYDFSESVPSWIDNLTNLTRLVILLSNFSGLVPSWIGNLTNLTSLDLDNCNFSGSIPSQIGNLTKLNHVWLADCNFSGTIPPTIGNLTQLRFLNLAGNNLCGKIPQSLFDLPALQELILGDNQLSGPLGDISAPSSSALTTIDLSNNQLSGLIPKLFFQLTRLESLWLDSNHLEGTMELSVIWRLNNLVDLGLSNNMLSVVDGEGDSIFPSLSNIQTLSLASCNLTKLPSALRYLDKISELDLSSNQISGVIPVWVWDNWKDSLLYLNLSHNMFISLEKSPSLVPITKLEILDLSFNRLQGNIPIPLQSLSYKLYGTIVLDYSNNKFSSILPDFGRYLQKINYLNLSNNTLNGRIPISICSASELNILDVSYNNFSGLVPSCLIKNGNLSILRLRENQFHGMLPENIREGCKLQTIDLNNNQIEGRLPGSLSNCQDLELLDVGHNQIVDSFPSWLGILPKLKILILRSNQFYGTLRVLQGGDRFMNHFSSLQILDLASNNFSGNLDPKWFQMLKSMMAKANNERQILGYGTNMLTGFYHDIVSVTYKGFDLTFTKILTTFKVIDFSNNSFDGIIPKSIGSLVSLHGINLSHNAFTGEIPSQLGVLGQLESLDLSWNWLSGIIPQELTSLTYLAVLNLSYNNLTGQIPQGAQFWSFNNSSFIGNIGLCGSPLSKQCNNLGTKTRSSWSRSEDRNGVIILFVFVGSGFGMGFAVAVVYSVLRRAKR